MKRVVSHQAGAHLTASLAFVRRVEVALSYEHIGGFLVAQKAAACKAVPSPRRSHPPRRMSNSMARPTGYGGLATASPRSGPQRPPLPHV